LALGFEIFEYLIVDENVCNIS